MKNILSLDNASFSYKSDVNSTSILNKTSYAFHEQKFYSIVAPSGTGKTTLISILAGLENLTSGAVNFNKQDIFKTIGIKNYRKKYSSIIFQSYNLIPYMTALENVLTAITIQNGDIYRKKSEKIKKAVTLLEELGLDDKQIHSSVLELSGGQQQRVAIARTLSSNAPIIFADEPTGNLDPETSQSIVDILKYLAHEKNKCVIVVTHDRSVASASDIELTLKNQKLLEV